MGNAHKYFKKAFKMADTKRPTGRSLEENYTVYTIFTVRFISPIKLAHKPYRVKAGLQSDGGLRNNRTASLENAFRARQVMGTRISRNGPLNLFVARW